MHEIKFRAWDKENECMIYPRAMNPAITIVPECDDNNLIYILTWQYWQDMKEATVDVIKGLTMQYTGLKDKNGKEIYEGDIVSSGEWIDGIIKWWDNSAQFFIADKEGYASDSDYTYEPIEWNKNLEVIGNIYENPELLESK